MHRLYRFHRCPKSQKRKRAADGARQRSRDERHGGKRARDGERISKAGRAVSPNLKRLQALIFIGVPRSGCESLACKLLSRTSITIDTGTRKAECMKHCGIGNRLSRFHAQGSYPTCTANKHCPLASNLNTRLCSCQLASDLRYAGSLALQPCYADSPTSSSGRSHSGS